MDKHPHLIFPPPVNGTPPKPPRGGPTIHKPGAAQQYQRFDERFKELNQQFAEFSALKQSTDGLVPERVLVLEVIGSIANFEKAIRNVPGFEFLLSTVGDEVEDEFVYLLDDDGKRIDSTTTLYITMSNRQGLAKLLSIWTEYKESGHIPRGLAKLRDAFLQLHDLRFWNSSDRIKNTGLLDDWYYRLQHDSAEFIPFEAELWFRESPSHRQQVEGRIKKLIQDCGGVFVNRYVFEEIRYHGVLGRIPRQHAQSIIDCLTEDDLIRCDDTMFFRPVGQCSAGVSDDFGEDQPQLNFPEIEDDYLTDDTLPVLALFDGYPFTNHVALKDRLIVDDPDQLESRYFNSGEQRHGTEMASLILHGDMGNETGYQPYTRKVYVRPIMAPSDTFVVSRRRQETIPEDMLPLDLIHRAVKRLFEPEDGFSAAAPSIKVINLSVGDMFRLFDTEMSPWAKMLDWLSYKYNVLFVVSAGNHNKRIVLQGISEDAFKCLSDYDRERLILSALHQDRHSQRMMSPAESINAITVKGYHFDNYSGDIHPNLIDPLVTPYMVSPFSPITLGKNFSVKPELMMPGGRQMYTNRTYSQNQPVELIPRAASSLGPGQKVACVGPHPADITRYHFTTGTSNAAALATRRLGFLYETLTSLKSDATARAALSKAPDAVIMKAMLIHGAQFYPEPKIQLTELFKTEEKTNTFKSDLNQFLGFGVVDEERIHACNDQQATMLYTNELEHEGSHVYQFPLPLCLNATNVNRRVIVTLAWFSPTNPASIKYNGSKLWVSGANKQDLQVPEGDYYHSHTQNGTAFHAVYTGKKVSDLSVGDLLTIQVNCRERAGVTGKSIQYALMVTVDAPGSQLPIYSQVKARVTAMLKAFQEIM